MTDEPEWEVKTSYTPADAERVRAERHDRDRKNEIDYLLKVAQGDDADLAPRAADELLKYLELHLLEIAAGKPPTLGALALFQYFGARLKQYHESRCSPKAEDSPEKTKGPSTTVEDLPKFLGLVRKKRGKPYREKYLRTTRDAVLKALDMTPMEIQEREEKDRLDWEEYEARKAKLEGTHIVKLIRN